MRRKGKPIAHDSKSADRISPRTRSAKWAKLAGRLASIVEGGPEAVLSDVREAILERSGESVASELLCLYRATQFLAAYGWQTEARALIADHQRTQTERGVTTNSSVYSFLRASVNLGDSQHIQQYPVEIRGLFPHVRTYWWARNVGVNCAWRANLHEVVLDHLRRPVPDQGVSFRRSDFERGDCLMNLGIHYYFRGNLARAASYFKAAVRALARDPSCDSRLKLVQSSGFTGRIALHEGKLDKAEGIFSNAIQDLSTLRHQGTTLYFLHHLAITYARRAEFLAAEEVVREILREATRFWGTKQARAAHISTAHATAAHFAIDQGDSENARRHFKLAKDAVRTRTKATDPILSILQARILSLDLQEKNYAECLKEFASAWHTFENIGDGWLLGLYRVALYRGHVHLKYGNFNAALEDALRCLRFARERKFFPAKSAGLLLKSQLLLQEKEGAIIDQLYEEVLQDLSSIRNPRVLFRVIANLYLHSWNRHGDLELTAYHMDQINRMREFLDSKSWDTLYNRYVVTPILHRTLADGFGSTPNETEE